MKLGRTADRPCPRHEYVRNDGQEMILRVADEDFEFLVEDSFRITGRGAGALGGWRSGQFISGGSGYVDLGNGTTVAVTRIDVEYARVRGGDRVALLLDGLTPAQVPRGSVIRSTKS
jgi:translation elongation factor EF-Tu-like GTPase